MPVPSVSSLRRENMPKIRPACSGSTPTPLSRTVTTHSSLSRSAETSTRSGASLRNFTALADEVLQHAPQLTRVAVDLRQRPHVERRAGGHEPRAQVLRHLRHQPAPAPPARG